MISKATHSFWVSTSGRALAGTGAFCLLIGSALAFVGPGGHVLPIIAITVPLCIIGGLFSVGFGVMEFPDQALAMILGLPFLGGVYSASLYLLPDSGTGVGVGLLLIAFAMLGLSARGGQFVWRRSLPPNGSPEVSGSRGRASSS